MADANGPQIVDNTRLRMQTDHGYKKRLISTEKCAFVVLILLILGDERQTTTVV